MGPREVRSADMYVGGAVCTCSTRFWQKVLSDLGRIADKVHAQPGRVAGLRLPCAPGECDTDEG